MELEPAEKRRETEIILGYNDFPMWLDIKRLGKETVIYGIGTIVSRYLNFLLVPFYSNVLSLKEYGILTNIYSYIALFYVIYYCGLDAAYMKYASSKELGNEKQAFSAAHFMVYFLAILFSFVFFLFRNFLARQFLLDEHQARIIYYVMGILFFDSISVIPFASLRFHSRPLKFAVFKALNVIFNLTLNILLVWRFKLGIEGVFLAGLGASFLTWLILLPDILRQLAARLHRKLWTSLLKFGLPFVPTRFSLAIMQVIDRPILLALAGVTTAGIYEANYKLGTSLLVLVSIFQLAWQPFVLKNADRPDAKILFGKVFTLLLMVGSTLLLILSLFMENLAKMSLFGIHLLGQNYWRGLEIVPLILCASLFYAFFFNFSAGLWIEKKTHILPFLTGTGAAVNIFLNLLLIPKYEILGAAWATLVSYMLMDIGAIYFSQRVYRIQYEYKKIARIGFGILASLGGYFLVKRLIPVNEILLKSISVSVYLVLLFSWNFLDFKSVCRALSGQQG